MLTRGGWAQWARATPAVVVAVWAAAVCGVGWAAPAHARGADGALCVVTTLPSIAAIVHEVGGRYVQVRALADEQGDPHFVDPQPGLLVPLNRADMLIANGLELEVGWLPPLQRSARNPNIQVGGPGFVEVAQFVELLEVPQARIDRSMGDLHPGGNPHFLTSPRQVGRIALGLADRLAALDPEHRVAFSQNAQVFANSLGKIERDMRDRFAALPAPRRQVIAYHKSLAYLFAWLDLTEAGTLEPRPGIQPTPKHLASLLRTMRAQQARVVVQEAYYPDHSSKTLARLAGGRVVVIPGNVAFRRHESYVAFFEGIARQLYEALGPPGGGAGGGG